jgi:ankyrin repeat protein/predicted enzyme related to lactoylglutathione lyase
MKQSLPPRASLEFLRKQAKEALRELRQRVPGAKLGQAQHELATRYGFESWRALKDHVTGSRQRSALAFFAECDAANLAEVSRLLDEDAELVHERHAHQGRTALHRAALAKHVELARLLLARGADPNARDTGDNAYPHHFAASVGQVEIVRACLDAGGDVHGAGDLHQLGVLGWALCLGSGPRLAVAGLLLERGARHHVFTAVAAQDAGAVQDLVEADPNVLHARSSGFEHGGTPLHFAAARADTEMLALLLQLGAELEASDSCGRTPLARAMLADKAANVRALYAAGAKPPAGTAATSFEAATPILPVSKLASALEGYQKQLGFELLWQAGDEFASVRRGEVRLFLSAGTFHGTPGHWVFVDVEDVDALHREYTQSGASIAEAPKNFPWGAREMHVLDRDGNHLRFASDVLE